MAREGGENPGRFGGKFRRGRIVYHLQEILTMENVAPGREN